MELIDRPDKDKPLGAGVTCEWFIYYYNPKTPWEGEKTLLHADTIEEVQESFKEKHPGMYVEKIEYYGIYF